MGSPPLVRDRHNKANHYFQSEGITPARAGKTQQTLEKELDGEDHPRSCGKDLYGEKGALKE